MRSAQIPCSSCVSKRGVGRGAVFRLRQRFKQAGEKRQCQHDGENQGECDFGEERGRGEPGTDVEFPLATPVQKWANEIAYSLRVSRSAGAIPLRDGNRGIDLSPSLYLYVTAYILCGHPKSARRRSQGLAQNDNSPLINDICHGTPEQGPHRCCAPVPYFICGLPGGGICSEPHRAMVLDAVRPKEPGSRSAKKTLSFVLGLPGAS